MRAVPESKRISDALRASRDMLDQLEQSAEWTRQCIDHAREVVAESQNILRRANLTDRSFARS